MTPYASRLSKSGAVLGAIITMVSGFEGLSLTVYQDPGDVPTVCYGETSFDGTAVQLGQAPRTLQQCKDALGAALPKYEAGMVACIKDPASVPDQSYIAFLDFTYNVGVGAFCGSTLARDLNAGDLKAACEQLPRWVYLGTTKLPGLVNRRAAEEVYCLKGVK